MSENALSLSQELTWRGFVAEHNFKDLALLDQKTHRFYWGTDPSADSLHIGHLAALMMCACFVRHGYTPFFLVGGATGQIGDPKDSGERELKPLHEIERNKKALAKQLLRVTGAKANTDILDNLDWFKDVKFLPFLREIGKSFSLTQLLDRQFVQARIGAGKSGISFAEFSYTLIQGYDFLYLFRHFGIDLQLCGSDQFGNCASGIHLIRRLENADAFAYSCPLILDPVTGRKFGKSEGNAVWLDAKKTSIFDFYQFWLNQPDSALETFLKYFTTLSPNALADVLQTHAQAPSRRFGQHYLAHAVTTTVHGEDAANSARKLSQLLFDREKTFTFANLSATDLDLLRAAFPCAKPQAKLLDLLVTLKLASSKSQAKQLLKSGAISLNGQKVFLDDITITTPTLIKKGKNKFALVLDKI